MTSPPTRWQRLRALAAHPAARRLGAIAERTVPFVLLGFIAVRLHATGWREVVAWLPRTPWFYLLWGAMYLNLPAIEMVLFHVLWRAPPAASLAASIRKRVYNSELLDHSGDVYLYLWARRRVQRSEGAILGAIKDNFLISSVTATLFAVSLLALLVLSGTVHLPWVPRWPSMVLALVAAAAVLGTLVRFRRRLLGQPARTVAIIAGLHTLRLAVGYVLQVTQWCVTLPEVPFATWMTYLALMVAVQGVPLLPSRDLIFAGAGIELSTHLDAPTAAVASMLIVASVLSRAVNLLLFGLLHRHRPEPGEHPADEAAAVGLR